MRTTTVRALTLIEVVALAVAVGLLLTLLVPALHAAGARGKDGVCLDNLRSFGVAVMTYAEDQGTLPGPLYPGVYQYDLSPTDPNDHVGNLYRNRLLTWKLRTVLGDSITNRIAVCPVAQEINPDGNFTQFWMLTGRTVPPMHYSVNNWGETGGVGGPVNGVRATLPQFYFGYNAPAGNESDPTEIARMAANPPRPVGMVANAAREWMIADAWYRGRSSASGSELQQEGPYQSAYSGEALPYFAPHQRRDMPGYTYSMYRTSQASTIRARRSDGVTNTVFFDGHAAAVPSKTLFLYGTDLLYGFPGTVNPAKISPGPGSPVWQAVWR
jgi:prepilin-type processing-associated H-X9-DG protein